MTAFRVFTNAHPSTHDIVYEKVKMKNVQHLTKIFTENYGEFLMRKYNALLSYIFRKTRLKGIHVVT